MKGNHYNYKHFFDLSPDLVCIAGFDGYFKRVNPAVSKLLGYSNEELYSRPINDFVCDDDKEATSRSRKHVIESNTLYNFENRYVTKSGEIVWLAWTSQPVESEKLVFGIAKDVTYKKQVETERLALLENLKKVNQEMKQFNLTTSHDLRSPLASLMSVFELLDVSKISDQETLQLIDILKLTGENLKDTLNSYVDVLSENISEQIELVNVNFDETLKKVIQSIPTLIKTSKTTIHSDFSKLETITFNATYLESIFLNLVTNAIKYAKPNCPPVVSIFSEQSEGIKQLIISDNGSGFDMKNVKNKIFGLHQTFHENPDSKGVGLYLVHSHITSLGGDIQVESTLNKGTRFTITFKE